MAVQISRFQPVIRSGGPVPNCIATTQWIDALVLVANTAQTYTPPPGASFLRITSSAGPLYINFNAVAVVPTATIINGTSSQAILCHLVQVLVPVPVIGEPLSVICAAAATVTIEAWS